MTEPMDSASSWEGWSPSWAQAGPSGPSGDTDEGDVDFGNVSVEVAAVELSQMLITLKLQNVLSARQACVLAFWAARSGATGMTTELAMRPD
jgi:hypothetical protein